MGWGTEQECFVKIETKLFFNPVRVQKMPSRTYEDAKRSKCDFSTIWKMKTSICIFFFCIFLSYLLFFLFFITRI